MKFSEVLEAVTAKTKLPKVQVRRALRSLGEVTVNALVQGEEVRIFGMGTLRPSHWKARQIKDPRNGAVIEAPASRGVKFQAERGVRKALNRRNARCGCAATPGKTPQMPGISSFNQVSTT